MIYLNTIFNIVFIYKTFSTICPYNIIPVMIYVHRTRINLIYAHETITMRYANKTSTIFNVQNTITMIYIYNSITIVNLITIGL